GVRIDLGGEADGLLDGLAALTRQAEDEGAVNDDAELVAILGKAPRHVDPHAFSNVVQNLLIAALVPDQQQAQSVVAHDLERVAWHVGLGVAGPDDAELAELARDRLAARTIVGEGIVVEEEFLHLRERGFRPADLVDDVADAARAVAMAADGLRPQAERAARFAAAAGIERNVRVL